MGLTPREEPHNCGSTRLCGSFQREQRNGPPRSVERALPSGAVRFFLQKSHGALLRPRRPCIMEQKEKEREIRLKLLEERIRRDGAVKPGNVLKVDSFLNHQLDVALFDAMGAEWKRLYAGVPVNKILTIEASGIGIACVAALHFGVPVVFAKKAQSINLDGGVYTAKVHSFTHQRDCEVLISQKYLGPQDRVLILDDFLANGCALNGLIELCEEAGAVVAGVGIAVEKGFQHGGDAIRARGIRVESLAVIEAMDAATGELVFRERSE